MASRAYGGETRSVSIGRVLSQAFSVIAAAPLLTLGVSFALVALPSALFGLITGFASVVRTGADLGATIWLTAAGSGLVWLLIYMATQAFLFRVTAARIDGRAERPGDHVAAAARSLLPLVGLAVLLTLAVWVGMAILFVPGVILAVVWSVAAPALVVERLGVFEAFGRSRYLTSGARWRIFGLVLLVFAIYFVALFALGLSAAAVGGLATPRAPTIISTITSVLMQTGFVAVWTTIQGALYVELRDWKDGPAGEQLASIFA